MNRRIILSNMMVTCVGAGSVLWAATQRPRGGTRAPMETSAATAATADATAAADHPRPADARYNIRYTMIRIYTCTQTLM
jgi:hypothetical protein